MHIDITAAELILTEPLKKYIETRIGSLERYLKRFDMSLVKADVEVSRTTKHHRHGSVFYAEVNLTVPGRLLRATHKGEDIRECIDKVKNILQREINKYKDRLER